MHQDSGSVLSCPGVYITVEYPLCRSSSTKAVWNIRSAFRIGRYRSYFRATYVEVEADAADSEVFERSTG